MKTEIKRDTKETQITLSLEYPGCERDINIKCGFFSHMLDLMAHRAGLGLRIEAYGDIHVDYHHLTEDIGIVFGQALKSIAAAEARRRYGWCLLPMDGSLARVALDFSGRGGFYWPNTAHAAAFIGAKCGDFDMELVPEFFKAVCRESLITMHAEILSLDNLHHAAEALFKGVGLALGQALLPAQISPSTKGAWL